MHTRCPIANVSQTVNMKTRVKYSDENVLPVMFLLLNTDVKGYNLRLHVNDWSVSMAEPS